MKRRAFIGLAAAGTAGLLLSETARAGRSFSPVTVQPCLLAFLHDEQVVGDIGRRYREMAPDENNARFLAEAILAPQPGTVSAALSARLERQVAQDFAGGRTVNVNGWILSVTEARQCALFSLQQD